MHRNAAGCISHDRFFLDRICTHMLAFEGDAHVGRQDPPPGPDAVDVDRGAAGVTALVGF